MVERERGMVERERGMVERERGMVERKVAGRCKRKKLAVLSVLYINLNLREVNGKFLRVGVNVGCGMGKKK